MKVPWTMLLRYRDIWPFLIGKLITDPVWWFYLFWLPSYLERERGQNPLSASIWIAVIYTGSSVGSIAGGWLSSTPDQARLGSGQGTHDHHADGRALHAGLHPRVLHGQLRRLRGVHHARDRRATRPGPRTCSPTPPICFPQKVSGSVVGLGATAGGIGGMFMTLLVGLVVQWTGNQQIVFVWAGVMHLASLALFWFWFKGRFVQVNVDAGLDTSRTHSALVIGGVLVAAAGAVIGMFVMNRWEFIVSIVKLNGALGAATVGIGFVIIGAALIYAAMPRKNPMAV